MLHALGAEEDLAERVECIFDWLARQGSVGEWCIGKRSWEPSASSKATVQAWRMESAKAQRTVIPLGQQPLTGSTERNRHLIFSDEDGMVRREMAALKAKRTNMRSRHGRSKGAV